MNTEKKNKHMELDDRIEIQECLCKGMAFKAIAKRIGKDPTTVFLSPIIRAGAWTPHEIYTWSFILMRQNGGQWELLTYGYG